jgi:hypothetical protein
MSKPLSNDEKIQHLLKIILTNRIIFKSSTKSRSEVFEAVLKKGKELKYFDDAYTLEKVRKNFWKHRLETYNKAIARTSPKDYCKLNPKHLLIHEIETGNKIDPLTADSELNRTNDAESQDTQIIEGLTPANLDNSGFSIEVPSTQIITRPKVSSNNEMLLMASTSKEINIQNSGHANKKFHAEYEKKSLEKLTLEIEQQKIQIYIAKLEATRLERKLNLDSSTYTVKNRYEFEIEPEPPNDKDGNFMIDGKSPLKVKTPIISAKLMNSLESDLKSLTNFDKYLSNTNKRTFGAMSEKKAIIESSDEDSESLSHEKSDSEKIGDSSSSGSIYEDLTDLERREEGVKGKEDNQK